MAKVTVRWTTVNHRAVSMDHRKVINDDAARLARVLDILDVKGVPDGHYEHVAEEADGSWIYWKK